MDVVVAVPVVMAAGTIRTMVMVMVMVVMMIVMVTMRMRGRFRHRAAFGFERRFDVCDLGAQPGEPVFQRRVARDPDRAVHELNRHVTIAQMPGDRPQIACGYFRDRLAGGNDTHDPAVFKPQTIAVAEHCRPGEIEQKHSVFRAPHRNPAMVAAVMGEFDQVRFVRAVPMAGG